MQLGARREGLAGVALAVRLNLVAAVTVMLGNTQQVIRRQLMSGSPDGLRQMTAGVGGNIRTTESGVCCSSNLHFLSIPRILNKVMGTFMPTWRNWQTR